MSKEDRLKNLYKVWGTKPLDYLFQNEESQFYADLAIEEIPAYEYRHYAREQAK